MAYHHLKKWDMNLDQVSRFHDLHDQHYHTLRSSFARVEFESFCVCDDSTSSNLEGSHAVEFISLFFFDFGGLPFGRRIKGSNNISDSVRS